MIEFFLDFILTGGFELLADVVFGDGDDDDDDEQRWPQDEPELSSRRALWAKIVLGVCAGVAWGYYVGQSREGWPGTFWTFSAVGLVAWAMSAARFSNAEWALGVERDWLRKLVTFTPPRLSNMAIFSTATAAAIAVGWFLAG